MTKWVFLHWKKCRYLHMRDDQNNKLYPPHWVVERITQVGGTNIYGEPNFRVIWGGNRTYQVTAKFKDVVTFNVPSAPEDPDRAFQESDRKAGIVTEVIDTRTLLKYHPFRWHMEKWCPPITYGSPKDWYENTWDPEIERHVLGAYPIKGDYEHVFFLGMCNHLSPTGDWCNKCKVGMGEFIPLEPNLYMLERQIWALLKSGDVLPGEQKAALFLREAEKRQVMRKIVGERVRGAMRPVLATQPTSWQSGDRCSVPESEMAKQWEKMPRMPAGSGIKQSDRLLKRKEEE
jgi:hypothetical protein